MTTTASFNDSLLDVGRASRPGLAVWGVRILQEIRRCDRSRLHRSPADAWFEAARGFQNASLIEVFRGDLVSAQRLCDRQLEWAAGLVEMHGVELCGELLLLPWINIGRIRRIVGDSAEALHHFALWPQLQSVAPVRVGKLELDPRRWQRSSARAFDNVLYTYTYWIR